MCDMDLIDSVSNGKEATYLNTNEKKGNTSSNGKHDRSHIDGSGAEGHNQSGPLARRSATKEIALVGRSCKKSPRWMTIGILPNAPLSLS